MVMFSIGNQGIHHETAAETLASKANPKPLNPMNGCCKASARATLAAEARTDDTDRRFMAPTSSPLLFLPLNPKRAHPRT